MLHAERHHRLRNDRVTGNEPQPPALRDRRRDQRELHPGEGFANAPSCAATERKVRERHQPLPELRGPAVGPETIGVIEEASVALRPSTFVPPLTGELSGSEVVITCQTREGAQVRTTAYALRPF